MGRILLAMLLGCMLTACATDQPLETSCARLNEFTIPQRSSPGSPAMLRASAPANPFIAALAGQSQRARSLAAQPPAPEPPATVAVILSGGGQWGAYGAGMVAGWSQHGRPQPRIVTGISTGALQSTFVFLGPAHDADLVRAYQPASEEELAIRRGDLFFLRNASTADIEPLKTYAARYIFPMLDEVAREAATGRLLLVGAVDARDGRFYMIDMTRMAATLAGGEREQCYTAALLASAAVPVIYRQVTINGDVWMDGGVRRSLFLPELVEQIGQAREQVLAGGDALVPTDGMVWAIKNGTTGVEPKEVPAKLLPTLNRLRQITFDQVETDSLNFARRSAEDHGLKLAFTTADGWDAPPRAPSCEGQGPGRDGMLFDPLFMKCLIDHGQGRWKNGQTPWEQ